jgi:DNA-binding beta-propeller fold protein YncE
MRKIGLAISFIILMIAETAATESGCWIANGEGSTVIRLAPNGTERQRVGGFVAPACVAIDPRNDDVWVGDTGDGRLTKLSKTGSVLKRVYVGSPSTIAVDPRDGGVWVAMKYRNEVVKVDANGRILFRIPDVEWPCFVAVDPRDGSCWTCDIWKKEIIKINANGSIIFRKRKEGSEKEYNCQAGVTDPANGQVIMFHVAPPFIVKFDRAGNEIWRFPKPPAWIASGYGLALDPSDRAVWVGETFHSRITKITATGSLLFQVSDLPFQPWSIGVCKGDRSLYIVGCGFGPGGPPNFMRLGPDGEKIVTEKRVGTGLLGSVAVYPGAVGVEPTSLGKIKAIFK